MTRLLAISPSSFICTAFRAQIPDGCTVETASHLTWSDRDLDGFDAVISFGFAPDLRNGPYIPDLDFDGVVAERLARHRCDFIALSSRRVYGHGSDRPFLEDDAPAPQDPYGANKCRSEARVRAALGDRATILRIANVFGYEPGRHTFFGRALQTLRETGRISLDVSPFVARDFIAVEDCARLLWRVALTRPAGTFNLGRGESVPVGRIALWLIEGFGRGELLVTDPSERDSFALDLTKLEHACGPLALGTDLRNQCIGIGRRLANECTS